MEIDITLVATAYFTRDDLIASIAGNYMIIPFLVTKDKRVMVVVTSNVFLAFKISSEHLGTFNTKAKVVSVSVVCKLGATFLTGSSCKVSSLLL